MTYKELRPHSSLRSFVLNYWIFEVPEDLPIPRIEHTVLPDGCVFTAYHFHRGSGQSWARLCGPRSINLSVEVYPGSVFIGARFAPGAAGALLKRDLSGIKNRIVDLAQWAPALDRQDLFEQLDLGFDRFDLLDAIYGEFIRDQVFFPDEIVMGVIEKIAQSKGNIKIASLVKDAPLSERPLQKRFRRHAGLTMKEFARVQRLRTTVLDTFLQRKNQFEALIDAGYFDQAHFINDFSAAAGISPTAFYHYVRQIDNTIL